MEGLNNSFEYFAYSRTALKHGLLELGVGIDQKILVPDYICEAVVQPLRQLGLHPLFYPLTDKLDPDWECLERLVKDHKCSAILMVHYFGQPQAIEQFKDFSSLNGLFLIEDNAHGFGGHVRGKLLGTFGDIGFSSPRKILDTQSGGILYHNGIVRSLPQLPAMTIDKPKVILKQIFKTIPTAKVRAYQLLKRIPSWDNPAGFIEPEVPDLKADNLSRWIISKAISKNVISAVAQSRREQWIRWGELFILHGIEPVFEKGVFSTSCPWMVPGYAPSELVKNQFVRNALAHGVMVQNWPALPTEVLMQGDQSPVARWRRLICIPLNLPSVPHF